MAAASDFPVDPETGRLVDPEVLAAARARRDAGADDLAERVRAAEERLAEAVAERAELTDALQRAERDLAAARVAEASERSLRVDGEVDADARLRALEREAERLRGADAETARLREELREAEGRASSLTRALQGARTDAAAAREELAREREEAAAELVRLRAARDARADTLEAVREQAGELRQAVDALRAAPQADAARIAALEAELLQRAEHEREVLTALEALGAQLDAARDDLDRRAARDEQVEALVAGLVEAAEWVRAGHERELAALLAERDAQLAEERRAFAAELAALEERLGALAANAARSGDELARERSAREAAEAALAALQREVGAPNPVYERPPAGSAGPTADHPALLRRPDAPADAAPPAVVVDLVRAAARLRAAGEPGPAEAPSDDPEPAPPPAATESEPEPVAVDDADEPPAAPDAEPPDVADEPELTVLPAAEPGGPGSAPWLGEALAALEAADAAAAERVLVALLPLQAARVRDAVSYAVVLPGREPRRVTAGPGAVAVGPPGALDRAVPPTFTLTGPVAALAPVVAGAAPRRAPAGVQVDGSRRRLRRLLRALARPTALSDLAPAGAVPRAADLLALLCVGVPASAVDGADFGVVYDVAGDRTLVRAAPDGTLTVTAPAGDAAADATVVAEPAELPAVLDGTAPTTVTGDAGAVATLQGWLRHVQQRPV